MKINNREIILQGSGTINGEGSGTPLSVPLTSGGSFNPIIDISYTIEKVDNEVYPYSNSDIPVDYILVVYSHVRNYIPGSNEYNYFDAMDKIYYYMIHNNNYDKYTEHQYRPISSTVKIFDSENNILYNNHNNTNAQFYKVLPNNKTYTFDRLTELLDSDKGIHKSDAPLNYLNYLPNEINKIKNYIIDDIDGMIIDTAYIKTPKSECQKTLMSDGFLTQNNTIVTISLSYPSEINKYIESTGMIVKGKVRNIPYIIGTVTSESNLINIISGTISILEGTDIDIDGDVFILYEEDGDIDGEITVILEADTPVINGTIEMIGGVFSDITGNIGILQEYIYGIEGEIDVDFKSKYITGTVIINMVSSDIDGTINVDIVSTDINGTIDITLNDVVGPIGGEPIEDSEDEF